MKKESNPGHKKKWIRPKLMVLTRGEPEEGVLATCKVSGSGGGNQSQFFACYWPSTCGGVCWIDNPS